RFAGALGPASSGGRVAARAAATGFAIASFSAMREPPRTATDVPSAPRPAATLAMCRSLRGAAAIVFGAWRRHVTSSIQGGRETRAAPRRLLRAPLRERSDRHRARVLAHRCTRIATARVVRPHRGTTYRAVRARPTGREADSRCGVLRRDRLD